MSKLWSTLPRSTALVCNLPLDTILPVGENIARSWENSRLVLHHELAAVCRNRGI